MPLSCQGKKLVAGNGVKTSGLSKTPTTTLSRSKGMIGGHICARGRKERSASNVRWTDEMVSGQQGSPVLPVRIVLHAVRGC